MSFWPKYLRLTVSFASAEKLLQIGILQRNTVFLQLLFTSNKYYSF